MNKETVELNLVNASALGIGMMPLDKVLTLLVLGTALIYNVLKIYSWYKNRKDGKGKIY
jgi:hypothetical protein